MFCILDNLREALITTAIEMVPRVRKKNKEALKKQQEQRQQKEKEVYNEKIERLALEQKQAIKYHKMYKGAKCWENADEVNACSAALKLEPLRFKALQENIQIWVLGFGRTQYHIKCSLDWITTSIQELIDRLKKIIEEEDPNNIPPEPPAEMPQRP